jgi:hypothetical protein
MSFSLNLLFVLCYSLQECPVQFSPHTLCSTCPPWEVAGPGPPKGTSTSVLLDQSRVFCGFHLLFCTMEVRALTAPVGLRILGREPDGTHTHTHTHTHAERIV